MYAWGAVARYSDLFYVTAFNVFRKYAPKPRTKRLGIILLIIRRSTLNASNQLCKTVPLEQMCLRQKMHQQRPAINQLVTQICKMLAILPRNPRSQKTRAKRQYHSKSPKGMHHRRALSFDEHNFSALLMRWIFNGANGLANRHPRHQD